MKIRTLAIRSIAVVGASAAAASSFATTNFFDLFEINVTRQLGASSLNQDGAYLGARVYGVNPGDVVSGTLTTPDGTNLALSSQPPSVSGSQIGYGSPYEADIPTLQADHYGTGTYSVSVDTGADAGVADGVNIGAWIFPDSQPLLTAASYNALQHASSATSTTVNWQSWSPQSGQPDTQINFVDLYDVTAGYADVLFTNGAASGLQSFTIGAGQLVAGHQYELSIDFSNRYNFTTTGDIGAGLFAGDTRTLVDFNATPEPASLAALGLGAIALIRKRRR